MANLPWAAESIPLLAGAPDLGVGLHLNLTSGPPVLRPEQVPSLLGADGRFDMNPLRLRFKARTSEVLAEWEAQLHRFRELLGRDPTHIDSHHHVHMLPRFTRVALELRRRHGLPAMRCFLPKAMAPVKKLSWRMGAHIARRYLRRAWSLAEADQCPHPDHTLVFSTSHHVSDLIRWLAELPDGTTELVCHPGYVDERLIHASSMRDRREAELAMLCHPDLRRVLEEQEIRLATYAVVG